MTKIFRITKRTKTCCALFKTLKVARAYFWWLIETKTTQEIKQGVKYIAEIPAPQYIPFKGICMVDSAFTLTE